MTHKILRERLLAAKGLSDIPKKVLKLSDLEKSEWVPEFETLMRNRMIMGALRYGLLANKKQSNYNYIEYLERKIVIYKQTGNTECLVDIANICQIAFLYDNHPNKHFQAEDDKHHCNTK